MRVVYKFAALALIVIAASVSGFSQSPAAAKALNLVRGVVGPVTANGSWSGYSSLNRIPGAAVIPITSKTTAFYLGFVAGTQADISNMVLYTTARNSLTITAAMPVTLGGISNPSISLTNKTVCPVQPISTGSPCIIKLDPVTLSLSALSDYYLVVYFTGNDSNNGSIGAAQETNFIGSPMGWFIFGDETQFTAGQSIPSGCCSVSDFLMYVMTN